MKAIADGKFEGKGPYGVPIIPMQDVLHTQVNLGLGPLHTQFDSKPCVAYTSLYADSQVAKYDYCEGKVLDKISIHYNIGHLMTMEGDTVSPDGKYLVALNKLAIDRFNPVGPLHPQNHQLIDISGDKMQLLYDMPLPLSEPHYVAAIKADKLKPAVRYKSGWDSRTDQRSPYKTRAGREKTERNCDAEGKCTTEVWGTVIRSHITPEIIEAEEDDTVRIHLTNLERAEDEVHGFALYSQNVQLSIQRLEDEHAKKLCRCGSDRPHSGAFDACYRSRWCAALRHKDLCRLSRQGREDAHPTDLSEARRPKSRLCLQPDERHRERRPRKRSDCGYEGHDALGV